MTTFIRGEHTGDYTQLSNKTLRDTSLSWKARGLLAYMLSHAPGYHIRADNLHTFSSDGPFTTSSAIKELKNKGYICFHKQQNPETKKWIGGNWVIAEEAGLSINRPSEKPGDGFIEGRLSRPPINRMLSKKNQEEKKNKKKEEVKEKKSAFLMDNDKFDPEDLPVHLGNNPSIMEAWLRYVQSRREKRQRITQIAYKMLIKKMMAHTPEEVIAALDKSSERGYTGVFYQDEDDKQSATSTSPRGQSNSAIVLDDSFLGLDEFEQAETPTPYSQRLYDFAVSVLGQASVDKGKIRDILVGMKAVYDHADTIPILGCPDPSFHPNHCVSWNNFFDEWIEFLEKKQQDGFVLRSVRNLEQTDTRWREYMQYCAWRTNHDWTTGAHI